MHDRNGMFGRGRFIRVHNSLLESPAFICLSASARQMLIDFVGYYDLASNYDRDISWWNSGIKYTFSMCRFPVGRTAFYDGIAELQKKGFITPHGDDLENGAPASYIPCERWRAWSPNQAQLRVLRRFAKKRKRCTENPCQIQFDFPDASAPSVPATRPTDVRQHGLSDTPGEASPSPGERTNVDFAERPGYAQASSPPRPAPSETGAGQPTHIGVLVAPFKSSKSA